MPVPQNKLKAALAAGERQLGLWLSLTSPASAEIASQAGFDWCLVDGEHAPNDIPLILEQVRALAAGSATPVVRLPVGDRRLVKQVLDLGVQSLVIPMIETEEEARAMVAATRYPPEGMRGVGAAMARAGQYGAIKDVVTTANNQICLILQAESKRALENLEVIASVDGVDGVFIGPADLAADMGYPGQPGAPEVQEAVRDAIDRINASGKAAGIIAFDFDAAKGWVDHGARFVAVGGDVALLASGIRAAAAAATKMKGG
ncbi:MAG: HpcH/HpaI aldolase/citrate lyase family protein [Paracoccaceae bacterium]|nr:HpcH/HpaI aldolase/citrate lyase family protein [Paracoccaceae bacterium]